MILGIAIFDYQFPRFGTRTSIHTTGTGYGEKN